LGLPVPRPGPRNPENGGENTSKRRQRSYTREQYDMAMRILESGLSLYKAAKKLGIPDRTLRSWLEGSKPPMARWVPRPSPELAYVLGALIGNGTVTAVPRHNVYMIRLRVKDWEFAHHFSECLAKVLNKKVKSPG